MFKPICSVNKAICSELALKLLDWLKILHHIIIIRRLIFQGVE